MKFGHLEGKQLYLGDLRSPWLSTTYPNWDNPPSTSQTPKKHLLHVQWDFQGPPIMGPLAHAIPIPRIPKDMGSWYGSRLPFSGVPCPWESRGVITFDTSIIRASSVHPPGSSPVSSCCPSA